MIPLQAESLGAARAALQAWTGREAYIHMETTQGAYARHHRGEVHPVGGFVRNARLYIERAALAGSGPYRLGLVTSDGYAMIEGLTHWEDGIVPGALAFYGLIPDGKLAAAIILSAAPLYTAGRQVVSQEWVDVAGDRSSPTPSERDGGNDRGDSDRGEAASGRLEAVRGRRTVLSIFPHPDDETFAAGATLARFAAEGARVVAVCLSLGELGRSLGEPPTASRATLPSVRREELRAAAAALGIERLLLYHLHDKTIEFLDRAALIASIRETIEALRPETIITYYPGYSVHPDHEATGDAVVRAVAALPRDRRPTVLATGFASNRAALGPPTLVVDTTPYWPKKLAAMRAHWTQTAALLRTLKTDAEKDVASDAAPPLERFREEVFWQIDVDRYTPYDRTD
ncbi:MAG: bacillithiol biosynthesis deacetylase BshB2 [Hydrogenibacillus sp.]|nr:bacillithiol biosynthesis deacetylase BshB2 [Hydrogenibacillus sp.]